jgi:ribonucleotide monophosphatase NagD (HAD superfamily)
MRISQKVNFILLRILMNGAELIAVHKGRYYSRGDGLALGPGPFVSALEFATGKTASVMGKPEKKFFLSALKGLNCKPHETIMIGDVKKIIWKTIKLLLSKTVVTDFTPGCAR